MSDRNNRRRRAHPPAQVPQDGAHAPESAAASPLAAFLDDAEAALSELREVERPSAPERGE